MDSAAPEQLPQSHRVISSSEVLGGKRENHDQDKLGQAIGHEISLAAKKRCPWFVNVSLCKETGSLAGTFVCISRRFPDTCPRSFGEQGVTTLPDPHAGASGGLRLEVFEKITGGCRSVYRGNASYSLKEINNSFVLCISNPQGTVGSN